VHVHVHVHVHAHVHGHVPRKDLEWLEAGRKEASVLLT